MPTRTLGEGGTARQVMADMFRGMFEQATNTDLSGVSDSELLDCFSYTLFPNTFLFPGISLPMVYRFRPDPRDHRMCIYEVLFLRPVPKDGKRPDAGRADSSRRPAIVHRRPKAWIPASARSSTRTRTICSCSRKVSEASAKHGLTLGNYQEIRVRHFEKTVDKYMAMEPKVPTRDFR